MNLFPLITASLVAFNWFGDGRYGSRFEAVAAMRQWIRDGGTADYYRTEKRKREIVVPRTKNEIKTSQEALRSREIQRLKKIAMDNWCYKHNASKYGYDTCMLAKTIGHSRAGEISFEDEWNNSIRKNMMKGIKIEVSQTKISFEEYDHKTKESRDIRRCKEEEETSQFICFRSGEYKVIKRFKW